MTKILFITYTQTNGGGAENVLTNLVNCLDPAKYLIRIIEVEQYDVRVEPLNEGIELLEPLIAFRRRRDNDAIKYLLLRRPEAIKPLHSLNGYDAVISWNYQFPSFCLRGFRDEKTVAWFHSDLYDLVGEGKELQRLAWKDADAIVTIARKSLSSLVDVFPDFAPKATIIHNAFNFARIRSLANESVSPDIAFTNDYPVIIGIGRLEDRKNFGFLIESFALLVHSGTRCNLLILGTGIERERLEGIVQREKVADSVLFAGYRENPYPYIRKSRLLAVSSLSEGFPTVVVESMALGVPFVTTPVAGASEELADGGRCGIVSGWDVVEYAAALERLLKDDELREAMSRNCVETVGLFSPERTVRDFDAMIEALPGAHSRDVPAVSRGKAVALFALAWATRRFTGVAPALARLKREPRALNVAKLLYRLAVAFSYYALSPALFAVGLYLGFRRGVKK